MLSFSRRIFHVLEAVLTLAYRIEATPLSGKELCEKLGLPPRYLEAMLQQLVHASLLRGVRGPSGGYVLARPPEQISIAAICDALTPEEEQLLPESELGRRVLIPLAASLEQHSLAYLQTITIADLCNKATTLYIKREGNYTMDFTI
jgi:Rrf2 family transcriptional regulator, iron-sulfur cluster assembly transcription factor